MHSKMDPTIKRHPALFVREARMSDMAAILDLSKDVYYGFDTIGANYFVYLHNPAHYPYVAEIDGKVVAFISIYVTNKGKCMVQTSARVHGDYTSQGIMDLVLHPQATANVLAMHPGIEQFMFTTVGSDGHDNFMARVGKHMKMETVHSWNVLLYRTDLSGMKKLVQNIDRHPRMRELSPSQSGQLIPAITSLLKSKSDWFIATPAWLPFRINDENVRYVTRVCDVRVTYLKGRLQSVSFGSHVQATNGPLAVLHVLVGNTDQCQGHIRAFLEKALQVGGSTGERLLEFHLPLNVDMAEITRHLSAYLGSTVNAVSRNNRTDGILVTAPAAVRNSQL